MLEYPQSGERIRGQRNIQASCFAQPSRKHFTVRRMLGAADLWTADIDGSHVSRLTTNPENDTDPAWSADGKWIYFIRTQEGTGRFPVKGETKLAVERMCHYQSQAGRLRFVALRYFNACGGGDDGARGEDPRPESHLIPLVLAARPEARFVIAGGHDTGFEEVLAAARRLGAGRAGDLSRAR